MKKILMGLAFFIAIAGALFTNGSSYAQASAATDITLYRPITGCPAVICSSTATTYVCTDLKINSNCSGSNYSGPLKRDIE
jgi:hypothetical protein